MPVPEIGRMTMADEKFTCPICDMELVVTDKLEPGLWTVYCPRYACDLPFYFIGLTREMTLKDFYEAAENWRQKHEQG